jgi:hypothetical protein
MNDVPHHARHSQHEDLIYGIEPGVRFALLLDGHGGSKELDFQGLLNWRAEQGILAAVSAAADGRPGEGSQTAADQCAGSRVVLRAVRVDTPG